MTISKCALALATLIPFASGQLPVWQQKYPPTTPGGLLALLYDDVGQRILGLDLDANSRVRLWRWHAGAWSSVNTQNQPVAGSTTLAACYDRGRNVLVMVRGQGSGVETWELAASGTWTQFFPSGAPSLTSMALHYSPARAASLLVGQTFTSAPLTVYEYASGRWQLLPAAQAPTTGASNTALDTARNRIVLFSGSSTLADTWEWDGSTWTRRQPNNSPPARVSTAMAYDARRQRCVLQGGSSVSPFTWEWNGDNWQINIAAPPAAPTGRMTYDAARGRMVFVATGGPLETWEYFIPRQATYVPLGNACTGSAGLPALEASGGSLPWLGETLTCTLRNLPNTPLAVPFGLVGSSRQEWLGIALPFDLGVLGASGCTLFTSVEATVQLVNAGGTAQWQFAIPVTAALLGAHFYQQALVLDPTANRFGASFTNAAHAVIGDH